MQKKSKELKNKIQVNYNTAAAAKAEWVCVCDRKNNALMCVCVLFELMRLEKWYIKKKLKLFKAYHERPKLGHVFLGPGDLGHSICKRVTGQ